MTRPGKSGDGAPYLEVQIHPHDIRRKVWYLFLTRRQVRRAAAGLAAFALFLAANLVVAPGVVMRLASRGQYRALLSERQTEGERLRLQVSRLGELRETSEALHLRMSRIYLAYGLEPAEESSGQGGFPFVADAVPESIYADSIHHGGELEAGIREQLRVLETFIDEVREFELAHGDQVRTTPSVSPLKGSSFVLTSPFGNRRSPFTKQIDFHPGIDLAAPVGTPVHAAADGVVVYAGRYPLKESVSWWRYGNLVAVRHGSLFITLHGHCDEIRVRTGQRVEQGEVIATVGNTGWSTSPHLHYEVRRRDEEGEYRPVDPRIYILDHRWRDEERLLVRARRAPDLAEYEPLPRIIGRRSQGASP
ncbi:MAG: M23 family metallopeptidase [Thermoanaerobaculia bacterium]|nr:M23 family metallopeptidase [Thermoanaerobaculia bacterium]